ncbi:phage major capsid protein [Caproiciproducens galactitolivorans]|uniref:Phage major capsid protein n=1 Tax=Caproiciproducens galactitolivorans TaxID=642589 RepID=A0ABT4BYH6_9FIRM|nr:phage major capsid protein [Caproiciproducens galactitolivorans]MCY1715088.1 phage major capsid protein [Caproiciproducens galactitolivorans]
MAFYESIKLEKGMYGTPGKSFTDVLESLDPSENYAGSNLDGLDAYQRQLKRFAIRVGGTESDRIEKFFQTADSAALFPEYVNRAVRQGMEMANLLPNLVATTTNINSMDYRTITSNPGADDKTLKPVAEGTVIPQTVVKTQDHLVKLHKRGRMLVASYEALRFQKLDLFTVTLRQIGAYIARAQLGDAVDVLLHGDDGKSPAGTLVTASDRPAYTDMVNLWGALAPYQLNTVLASTATTKDILSIAEFKDANAGLNFQGTGKLATPFGANLLHMPNLADKQIIGLDKTCALEMVQAGGVQTDYDKLIDRQLERACISTIAGFTKIFDGAVKVLNYKA